MKKGQVSLEFVMTYGWAILIVLIVTVVAWQWGLFSGIGTPKPGSTGFWGVEPEDFVYRANGNVEISFMNKIGASINLSSINITVDDVSYHGAILPPSNVSAGGRWLWNLPAGTLPQKSAGSRYEIFLIVNYTDDRTGDNYRSSGRLWGTVEA